jgi:outer membrane protein assembly factor BamD (BamD/ComL family)
MKLIRIAILIFCSVLTFKVDAAKTVYEYYGEIAKNKKAKNWENALSLCHLILKKFPKSELVNDVEYQLGIIYFNLEKLDCANDQFSKYLESEFSPKHYEDAVNYKFQIAEKYYKGAKKHLFNCKKFPRWGNAKVDALKIFEEVIKALPNSRFAITSLFNIGKLHSEFKEYDESIEAFQTLIKKFPKSDLAVESFLLIGKVYLKQADPKHPEANLLDLARINLKKFEELFPQEERIEEAREDVIKIEEVYAKSLFEIGKFFEKTKKIKAARVYYEKIISTYPSSKTAKISKKRLEKLENK